MKRGIKGSARKTRTEEFLEYVEGNPDEAVTAIEDKRFFRHSGIDALAIVSAIRTYLRSGVRRGASTISMQLAPVLAPEIISGGVRGKSFEPCRDDAGRF
ncbi:MAG: transglycosylase domain-containing protein, partial [Bdellovibrionota bacterium]